MTRLGLRWQALTLWSFAFSFVWACGRTTTDVDTTAEVSAGGSPRHEPPRATNAGTAEVSIGGAAGGRGGTSDDVPFGGSSASTEGGVPPSGGQSTNAGDTFSDAGGSAGSDAGSGEAGLGGASAGSGGSPACEDDAKQVSSCGYADEGTRTQTCVDGQWSRDDCRVVFGNARRFSQGTVVELLVQQVAVPLDTTLDKLGILATGNGFGAFSLALYSDAPWQVGDFVRHEPGPLFAGATTTLVPNGVGAFELDLPDRPLPMGIYWIAYAVDFNGGIGYESPDSNATTMCYCNETYGNFTEPFSWRQDYPCLSMECFDYASVSAYVVTKEP